MITPTQKIDIMREYAKNPAEAILTVLEMLRKELENYAGVMRDKILADLKEEMPDLEKVMNSIKGADGEDADAEEVAQILADMPEFVRMTKGDKGDDGKTVVGPPGPRPVVGIDFVQPKDGSDGKNADEKVIARMLKTDSGFVKKTKGDRGDDGVDGKNGKDGSPDKPLEIAAKLNTTQESVDVTVIKGLKQFMTDIRVAVRGSGSKTKTQSGGGMGNWVHEQFAVSSATTTVTLSTSVAANGTAIMVRYQGQLLAHTVQYTISGRVITLGFTPEDDTTVDVTYVRK